jgi:hypothetical protein
MSSPKFERVKEKNPDLSKLLDELAQYIRLQLDKGQPFIVPRLAAAALDLNDGEAFVLLELLAKEDILRRVYNVYCGANDVLLATVNCITDFESVPHCDYCDEDHSSLDLKIEIAFILIGNDLIRRAA